MPSLKRKHKDLQCTAKTPGQMKLSFVQSIPKEPEMVSVMVRLIKIPNFTGWKFKGKFYIF